MLAAAIEAEVAEWIDQRAAITDGQDRRQIVRNGHQPTRAIQTGLGDLDVARPCVHDRRTGPDREQFHSGILPPYLRRTKAIEEMLP